MAVIGWMQDQGTTMKILRERYIDALKAKGSVEVESKSRKYVTLTRPEQDGTFYFIGKSGAIRYGKNSSSSTAASPNFKQRLLGEI